MTDYGESLPVKQSFFTDQTGWSAQPAAAADTRNLKPDPRNQKIFNKTYRGAFLSVKKKIGPQP
jgi:hypothetical protein